MDELIDGTLPPADASRLREHATGCATCAADMARAERFRALMAGGGRVALARAADHGAAIRAREAAAAAGPRPGALVRLRAPLAAAAMLVAGVGLGWAVAPSAPTIDAVLDAGEITLSRGERRTVGDGRTVVADTDTKIVVPAGSDGSRLRLDDGAAVFQVVKGKPFTVETELGTVDVRGTLFHVARRPDRSVTVGVMSGVVVFTPKGGGATRTLRERTTLTVAPDGGQRLLSDSETTDLTLRLEMQALEMDALRGDLVARDEELAALRAQAGVVAAAAAPAKPGDTIPWRELGVNACKLLALRPDDPAFLDSMSIFLANSKELAAVTGAAQPWDWPMHPVVIARSAPGFVEALAPSAPPEARARAAAAMGSAAEEYAKAATPDALPTAVFQARMRMLRAIIVGLREELGADPAAELARAVALGRDGMPIRVSSVQGPAREEFVGHWVRQLDLTDAQRAEVQSLSDRRIDATLAVQRDIIGRLGDATGRAFLFPQMMWGGPRRPRGDGIAKPDDAGSGVGAGETPRTGPAPRVEPAPVLDAPTAIATALSRIDAKLALTDPRLEFERAVRVIVTPEQYARGFPPVAVVTFKE
ncbi:MAG: FecR domain-containing protein [Planctomycetes bacterium]|nr:FecR domain-containing protein [Planctomycetota bacterium]